MGSCCSCQAESTIRELDPPLIPGLNEDVAKSVLRYAISDVTQIPNMALVSKTIRGFVLVDNQLWLPIVRGRIPAIEQLWKFLGGKRSLCNLWRRRVHDRRGALRKESEQRPTNLSPIPEFSLKDCALFVEAFSLTDKYVPTRSVFLSWEELTVENEFELELFSLAFQLPNEFHGEICSFRGEAWTMRPLGQVCFVHKETADQAVLPYDAWVNSTWPIGRAPYVRFREQAGKVFRAFFSYGEPGFRISLQKFSDKEGFLHENIAPWMVPG